MRRAGQTIVSCMQATTATYKSKAYAAVEGRMCRISNKPGNELSVPCMIVSTSPSHLQILSEYQMKESTVALVTPDDTAWHGPTSTMLLNGLSYRYTQVPYKYRWQMRIPQHDWKQ